MVTIWDPTWMFDKFRMKFLKDPKGIFAPPQSLNMIAQKGFSERYPEARELLAGIFVSRDDIAAISSAVKDGKTTDAAVKDWINAHADLIKRWQNIKGY